MSGIVLHHYTTSPFSEKVRLVLGLKGLRWRSVMVPNVMPKPDVVALTGGYRRTPFMQIGADIFCDSALICRVIDRLAPEPPLYPEAYAGVAEIVAQWADSALFWAAVPFTMQPAGAAVIFAGAPADAVQAFAADRAAMLGPARRAPTADAGAALRQYLARLQAMLADSRPYLLGALPSIADVAAAQSIWFIRRAPPVAETLPGLAALAPWYERVHAFGQGGWEAMSSADAIALAAATPTHAASRVVAGSPFSAGDAVTVTAADYAQDDVAGDLVGLDDDEVVVARTDERAGTVHVHFPRIGYHVRSAVARKEVR